MESKHLLQSRKPEHSRFAETDQKRRDNMAAIKSKNTKPELVLRRLLFARGFRYRLYGRKLPGKPDLVFSSRKAVIFVNGCFWHHHSGCSRAALPKTNQDYWLPKIKRNVERDREDAAALTSSGWRVLVVWECSLKSRLAERTALLAADWLNGTDVCSEITVEDEEPCLKDQVRQSDC